MRFRFFKGFRSWLKNPEERKDAADYFAALHALEVPDDISSTEIRKMVARLFVQADDDFNFERLKIVGSKAVPELIEALADPRTSSAKFNGHILDSQSPFERICDLLGRAGAPEAASPLARYVSHHNEHFRKLAALTLGSIGTSECIAPLVKALDDDDDYVRSYAMMGIERGIDAGRCTKEFLDAMMPWLAKLLNRDDGSVSGSAPKLLLRIDANRALPILLAPTYFTIENSQLHYIVGALNDSGQRIPHDRLLPFLASAKSLSDQYPYDYQYAEALRAYAHNPDPTTEAKLRAELNATSDKVRVAAAEALAILLGVVNARDVVFSAVNELGFNEVTRPQQVYYAVSIYDAEVNNGGHAQYFVNSPGETWRIGIEGLKAIGAGTRASILQAACAFFGANGPSANDDERHRQIARFSAHQDDVLSALDDKYYSSDENVEMLLALFTLANPEHFLTSSS